MKHKKLFLSLAMSLMTITTWADVAINATNFPDANFRSWVSSNYGSNGKLTSAKIANVTRIDVASKKISSLKGIEFFTALTSLRCTDNQLTSLDLSKNTALTSLICSYNRITSLDLSKNTALTKLDCFYNRITSLDLSKNIALTELNCSSNRLTSLDVSGCTALNYLGCTRNQLTSLNVSKNTALEILYCYSNQLSSLNVSGYTALTELSCYDNQLTSLDVSGCTALIELYCTSNQLTSLNVSGCMALTLLSCNRNQIKGAEMDALVESLSTVSDGKMQVIYYQDEGNVMTTTQVAAAKAKGWIPQYYSAYWKNYAGSEPVVVEGIVINETNFPDENFRNWILSQSYGNDGILTEEEIASVTQISVTEENIQDLEGIEHFIALRALICWGNGLTYLDLSRNTELEELYCSNNKLTSLDLSKNTALTNLECYDNQLTSLDLSKNTALISLECYDNQLTSLNVSGCTALEYLYCYGNQLTSLNVSNNTKLKDLSCDDNHLTSLNVSGCTALEYLYCYNNQLSSLNVSKNTELTTLYCYQNKIKGAEMDALVESLPIVSDGEMIVIFYEDEGNMMTTAQVASAKYKGWTPYYTEGELDEYDEVIWIEYTGSDDDILRGDVNGDGKVDMDDATFVTNIILGTEVATEAADVNKDGEIGMSDVMFIIHYIKNGKFPDE